jgi:hypothetical protein
MDMAEGFSPKPTALAIQTNDPIDMEGLCEYLKSVSF